MKLVLSFSIHVLTNTLHYLESLGSPRNIVVLRIMAELPLRLYVGIDHFVDADTLLCVESHNIIDGGIFCRVGVSVHTAANGHGKSQRGQCPSIQTWRKCELDSSQDEDRPSSLVAFTMGCSPCDQ
jgi:hypothetical protein